MPVEIHAIGLKSLKDVTRLSKKFDSVYLTDCNVGKENAARIGNLIVFDHHDDYFQERCSTEQVLDYLKHLENLKNLEKGRNAVCTDNFDADALLSTFSLANPNAALKREWLLRRTAEFSDFTVFSGDYAIHGKRERKLFYAMLDWLNKALKQKKIGSLKQKTIFLRASVKKLGKALENIEVFSNNYKTGFKTVKKTVAKVRKHIRKENRFLSVLELEKPLHENFIVTGIAVYAASKTPVVLRIERKNSKNNIVIGVKTSAESKSINLTPVLKKLRELEKNKKAWWFGRRDVVICSGNSSLTLDEIKHLINAVA